MAAISPLNVIIIGGSLSGLMHGIVLSRSGHRVQILERSPIAPESRGAGISCRKYVLEFFEKWDSTQEPYYTDADTVRFLNREGNETRKWRLQNKSTSWALLYWKLRRNFDGLQSDNYPHQREPSTIPMSDAIYQLGKTVTNVKYEAQRVTVEYKSTSNGGDTTSLEADLVIVADGSRSRTRRMLQPELVPTYTGYVAWRGLVPEKSLSSKARDFFGNHLSLFPMGKGHMIIYFIPREHGFLEENERDLNWAWYCNYPPNSPHFDEIMMDNEGKFHKNSLPIGKVRASVWERQKDIATKTLPRQLAEIVLKTDQPFIQSINELRSPRASFFDGKLLMVGDALACCRPHIASSTEQAALNAILLHKYLHGKITITEWEKEVLHFSQVAFLHSKCYGLFWQHGFTFNLFLTFLQFAWVKLLERFIQLITYFDIFIRDHTGRRWKRE